jgi:hypothetical protein
LTVAAPGYEHKYCGVPLILRIQIVETATSVGRITSGLREQTLTSRLKAEESAATKTAIQPSLKV